MYDSPPPILGRWQRKRLRSRLGAITTDEMAGGIRIAANAYTGQRLYGEPSNRCRGSGAGSGQIKQLIRDTQPGAPPDGPIGPAIGAPEPVRAGPAMPAAGTQPEIVLWKSIENSTRPDDFRGYLNSYPNGAYASIARLRLAAAQKMESSAREASDFKTFTLPVEHERSGMIYHWCYGHIRLTPEGAAYDGDRDRIGFSKVDVISVGVGPDGVEFRLKDGQRWQFSLISEADVGRRKIKDNQPGDYSLARLLAERWGLEDVSRSAYAHAELRNTICAVKHWGGSAGSQDRRRAIATRTGSAFSYRE